MLKKASLDLVGARQNSRSRKVLTSFRIAPSVLADVDDTARVVITLNQLGRPTSPEKMLSFFEADRAHLRTYLGERDSSFSANCNGLMAILHAPHSDKYLPHIETITDFLCTSYLSGVVKDKWVRIYLGFNIKKLNSI